MAPSRSTRRRLAEARREFGAMPAGAGSATQTMLEVCWRARSTSYVLARRSRSKPMRLATIHKRRLTGGEVVWELTHGTGVDRVRVIAGRTREEAQDTLAQFKR